MSSPVNRTALRAEENRPAPTGRQVSASAVSGPTPYSRPARTFAPCRCRAACSSWCRSACIWSSRQAGHHGQRSGDLPLPGRGQVRGGGRPGRGQPLGAAQGALAQRLGALAEEHRVDPLHPRGVLAAQVVAGPPAAPGPPGPVRAGAGTPGAGPRPAAAAGAGRRSCRSWRAACGRGRTRCRPARPGARRSRRRPAPRRHTATRYSPRPRTRHHRARRTGPARPAGAPGPPARPARGSPARTRCRGSRRSATSGEYRLRLPWASGPPQAPEGNPVAGPPEHE
jgi:hypothetical protein